MGIQRYLTFCRALDLVPVPSTKRQVALFATHLSTSLRLPTIRVYLAAVSFLHHVGGHRSPVSGNTILKLVLRGIQRKQTQSQCKTPRLPITPQILADLLKHLGCDSTIPSQDRLMLKAAMSLAFFGFLRVSELTVPAYHTSRQILARRDIQFLGHQLKVFLTHSKTDQFGQGSVITVGCSEDACCPVSAMQHYLESCRTPPSRPLFHFRNGMPLTARSFERSFVLTSSRWASTRPSSTLTAFGLGQPLLLPRLACHPPPSWSSVAGAVLLSIPTSVIIRPTPLLLLRWQRHNN